MWEFLDFFTEVWKAGVLPPGVTTWDNTMNNSTYQAGKAVFVLNAITISLWLEDQQPRAPGQDRALQLPPRTQAANQPVTFGSRSIMKYTKVPDLAKQFLWDSMEPGKMDREYSSASGGRS